MKKILSLLTAIACVAGSVDAKKPNVVIVITDDQGYGDLSCHGNPVLKTPNLDKLHDESVRLTDYHVAPTCSPTRAALITGHWTNRTGVWHTIMGRSMLRANEVTIGQIFKDGGYSTAMIGKWHLGDNYPYRPEDRGFEWVYRHGGGGVGQTPDYWDNAYFDGSYWFNGKAVPAKGFCTDVFFNQAKKFMKEQQKKDNPFLVYLCMNAPHGPMHSPVKYSLPYKQLHVNVANFYGMIANIDDNVGKLRTFLRETGLEDDTILIFTTDNGSSSGAKIFNDGMRGQKGSEYDGGHRVPFFISWPNGKLGGGHDVKKITSYVDVVPTLIDMCGVPAPRGVKFDGTSIKSLLYGTAKNWPDRILVTDSQRVRDPIKWRKSAVMTDRWRLNNGKELYDIDADPGQRYNIAEKNPKVVQRLTGFYDKWWADLEPSFKLTTEIYLGHPKANPVRLTSHDWITDGSTPWNQAHIRKLVTAEKSTGFWAVKVIKTGNYEVELRRWPKTLNEAISASIPAGPQVPGARAYRANDGKSFSAVRAHLTLGGNELTTNLKAGATNAKFRVKLEAGNDEMWAKFSDKDGNKCGAYYAYVTKL
jgi:arylsulfatase A-like enzyme